MAKPWATVDEQGSMLEAASWDLVQVVAQTILE